MDESLQIKAEGKKLKKPLRVKGESPAQIVEKIVAYNIDKVIDIEIPVKRKKLSELTDEEKKEREQKKQQKKDEAKKERAFDKMYKPLLLKPGKMFITYRNMIQKNNYKDNVKEISKKWRAERDEDIETFEEKMQEKDEDYEIPEEDFDKIEEQYDVMLKQLIELLKRGARGDFTDEAKLKRINEDRVKRGEKPLKELPKSK
jgi:organic radical activating enzyme